MQKDLVPLSESREEFLARCAYQRIEESSRKYDEDFNKYLSMLEESELSYDDLNRLAQSLKSLSVLISASYKSLTKTFSNFQKYFLDKGPN